MSILSSCTPLGKQGEIVDVPSSPVASASLSDLRAARGLTRRALASLAGVGESTIRRIETGDSYSPGPAVVRRLCAALAVSERDVIEFRFLRRPVVARSRVRPRSRLRAGA